MGDFYDVLNIPKHSSADQIRQAYKALVRKWHPDKHPPSSKHEAETKFKSITQAYEALSSGEYQNMFGVCNSGGEGGPNWWWRQQQQQQQQQQQRQSRREEEVPKVTRRGSSTNCHSYHPTSTTTSSPLSRPPGTATFFRRKPPPIERRLECTLEELFRGCKKEVRYTRDVVGKNGTTLRKEEVETVKVKPGWKKGTKVTLEGRGDERPGGAPSDVVLVVSEKEHPYFKRTGNDLVLKLEVPLVGALTGWTSSFPLIGGEKMSCSFEGEVIFPGYEKVVKGEGMPLAGHKGVRGDLRIKFCIVFPKRLSQHQKNQIKNVLKDCCY